MAIYLDHAATTQPSEPVISAITDCLREHWGNPSSLHSFGLDAENIMKDARAAVAGAIGAEAGEILFTSGATEASNLALRGIAGSYGRHKRHIITSAVEHSSVRSTMDALEAMGYTVTRILPREDGFHREDFLNAVGKDSRYRSPAFVIILDRALEYRPKTWKWNLLSHTVQSSGDPLQAKMFSSAEDAGKAAAKYSEQGFRAAVMEWFEDYDMY